MNNDVTLGVDLGGTNLRAAVVDVAGNICGEHREHVEDRSPAAVADAVAAAAFAVLRKCQVEANGISVGIGVAGMIRKGTGFVVNGPNLGWRDVPFDTLLAARLPGARIVVHNDLSVAVWGEYAAGAGRGIDDLAMVLCGSGIGCGLVLGGRLFRGAAGVGSELGHVKMVPDGELCGCGERGCLEAYAGGHNLARRAREAIVAGTRSALAQMAGGVQHITAETVAFGVRAGDPLSLRIVDEAGAYLGKSLGNLVTLLNPARLVLGGSVYIGIPRLADSARAGMLRFAGSAARASLTVMSPELGDDAGVIGAALLARM